MEQLKLQYNKFLELGAFQEMHVGFQKTLLLQPRRFETNYKAKARIDSP